MCFWKTILEDDGDDDDDNDDDYNNNDHSINTIDAVVRFVFVDHGTEISFYFFLLRIIMFGV